jgi:hypothetical protein
MFLRFHRTGLATRMTLLDASATWTVPARSTATLEKSAIRSRAAIARIPKGASRPGNRRKNTFRRAQSC